MKSAPTLSDVAARAGVSLASVDRVVNGRPNVSPRTAERVRRAMGELGYRPDPMAVGLARGKRYEFVFLLPVGENAFMADLAARIGSIGEWLAASRATVRTLFAEIFDPDALAAAIDGLDRSIDGAAIVALDHPKVRSAIDRLVRDGIPVVTLVSDVPSASRLRFVGIDNAAAGRSAGALLGRFGAGRTGSVGILAGSLSLRDHVERCFGFRQVIERDFPDLTILPFRETRDDRSLAADAVRDLMREHPDLVAIYNCGAGNAGIAEALGDTRRRPVVVAHELTPASVGALQSGCFDAILAQDPGHEIRSAARILLAHASGSAIVEEQERIRIEIFIAENLPA